ncbi:hypothetical protein [Pseudomonas ovata]|uniref:hypothetical protein n=1 Tax=Pseudomonas ovata TaxID=1839709 RepID=UPI000D68919C|nr:hypothetical protein [Pseudomonas ovata]
MMTTLRAHPLSPARPPRAIAARSACYPLQNRMFGVLPFSRNAGLSDSAMANAGSLIDCQTLFFDISHFNLMALKPLGRSHVPFRNSGDLPADQHFDIDGYNFNNPVSSISFHTPGVSQ